MPATAQSDARDRQARLDRLASLRTLLLALPLLVLLPLLAYSGVLLWLMADQARHTTERGLVAANQALNLMVQHELDQAETLLKLVANSAAVGDERIDVGRMLSAMAQVARSDLGLESLALVDRAGNLVVQYPPRPGTPSRIELAPHHRQVFDTGETVLSNLHPSRLDGQLSLSLNYPVWQRGNLAWVLSARLNPQHLARIMSSQVGMREAVATLMDPQPVIVARTREMDRFFGKRPSAETLDAVASGPRGTRRFPTLDGNDYFWAWSTTDGAGWHVFLGIPAREVDAALRSSMLQLAGIGLLLLLLGLGAAVLLARRITRTVDRMIVQAPALLAGTASDDRTSGIRQLDALHDALREAGRQVRAAIADRDRALAAEREARVLADEDNRAKDVFIATLSHELRNPLAPVRQAAMLLRSGQSDTARRQWAVEVIERQSGAMARLLDDLLDISRIRSGRIVLDRQPVSLRAVLESAAEVARPLLDQRGHLLHMQLPPHSLMLDADPLRLSQVFSNLLTNAAKYTDPGGRIEVTAQAGEREVVVRVQDNGIGIAADALPHVFEMFNQVRGGIDRSQGGLGIGLALVRGLVELHGGWVSAESEGAGRGSAFVVGLPLAQH